VWAILSLLLGLSFLPGVSAPTPPPPSPLQPLLALASPTVSPLCKDAGLPVALLAQAAPSALAVLEPVVQLCGAVPVPTGGYECALDTAEINLLNQVTGAIINSPSPIAPQPVAGAVLQVQYIEAAATSGAKPTLTPVVVAALQCAPLPVTKPPPPDRQPGGIVTEPAIPPTAPVIAAPVPLITPALPTLTAPPSLTAAPAPSAPEVQGVAPQAIVTTGPVYKGFRYSAVMLAPLVLLALAGFVAHAFTRPIRGRRRETRRGSR
jgi:hypothetical protein